ncbi:MAG TPA: spondin domain-containing protein [Xanthomonadales bacterium]|nr:spondin domain-containing protein [Xanthomonadales bacterium]
MKYTLKSMLAATALGGALFSGTVLADSYFEVTVTNLTKGITFTPALVATTRSGDSFFLAGDEASSELETLAESGAAGDLADSLDAYDVASLDFIGPGASGTTLVATKGQYKAITIASMLIPTNDTFFALNGVDGPNGNKTIRISVPAYDAGTELNDELCANLPGPGCGGDPGPVSDNGEGYVYISNGVRGVGDLDADLRDWRNPVARITITRVNN